MVRFIVLYNKPENIEAFERHYWEVHIPLAKKLTRLKGYRISRNIAPVRGEPYYLVAELEWDTMDDLKLDFQSPEGRETADDVTNNLGRLSPGVRSMIYELGDAFELLKEHQS